MEKSIQIKLLKQGENSLYELTAHKPIIVLGGNGTGKSRFGFFIEQNNHSLDNNIIRISAQRSLTLPKEIYRLH